MAVSKRTRFEVLRRDNYTCRYCRSADNPLRIDHVTPVALGGTDDPTNLVAACQDCNAGKASTSLSEEHVADVKSDTIRWSAAIKRAAEEDAARDAEEVDSAAWFRQVWREATFAGLPDDWARSIATFASNGLTNEALTAAVKKVESRQFSIPPEQRFRYFCGICWGKVRELRARAEEILAEEAAGHGA